MHFNPQPMPSAMSERVTHAGPGQSIPRVRIDIEPRLPRPDAAHRFVVGREHRGVDLWAARRRPSDGHGPRKVHAV